VVEISSTLIREKVVRGESISDLVPIEVADYIHQHGLYR
jgi:nicotinic acid mononucleotide adenylyltransferase